MDPRTVDTQHRKLAICIVAFSTLGVTGWFVMSIFTILSRPPMIRTSYEDTWGNLPDMLLCAFKGNDVHYAFTRVYAPTSDPESIGFRNDKNPQDPLKLRMEVLGEESVDEKGAMRGCLRIGTSDLEPRSVEDRQKDKDNEGASDLYIEFKVSFERKLEKPKPDDVGAQIAGVPTSLSLAAYEDSGEAGVIAYVKSYDSKQMPVCHLVSVKKFKTVYYKTTYAMRTTMSVRYEGVVERVTQEPSSPPNQRVLYEEGALHVSNITDANSPKLRQVVFGIQLRAPAGEDPIVEVYYISNKFHQCFSLLCSMGGYLAIVGAILKFCFPLKYPDSAVRATVELRTIRGNRSKEKNVTVDPEVARWRKFRPGTKTADTDTLSKEMETDPISPRSSDSEQTSEERSSEEERGRNGATWLPGFACLPAFNR